MNLAAIVLPYMLGVLVLFVLSRLSQKEAVRHEKARELPEGGLEFSPDATALVASRLLIGVFGVLGVTGLVESAINGHGLIAGLFCGIFALILARLLPGVILLTAAGLEQRFWLGKPKTMRWKDVQFVSVMEKKRRVAVLGRGGTKIVYYKQLPDMERLVAELAARCPEAMPREEGKRRIVIPPPPPVEPPSVTAAGQETAQTEVRS